MKSWKTYIVPLIAVLSFLGGCFPDAPHDNPLDPSSRAFSDAGTLTGKVLSFYEPFGGISGALVTIQSTGSSTLTSSTGAFSISEVPTGKDTLIVSRSGYLSDTLVAQVSAAQATNVTVHLDAMPVVGSCQVMTRKIDQWWPHAVYSALVNASVADPDGAGDVAGVTLAVDTFRFAMTYVPNLQIYQVTLNASVLPQGSLEWLVGKSLSAISRDKVGATMTGKPFSVTRIIQDAPVPQFPTALDTITTSPMLSWTPPSLQFPYTYKLEMYRLDQGLPSLIWSLSNLSSSATSYQYPDSLTIGLYYWTISVVDEFGNLSRSKEASFYVVGPSQ
jgi:hypothetical protein